MPERELLASPAEDAQLGILWYASASPGTGGRIKEDPDDFVVVERTKWPRESADGEFLVLQVRARNWETNRLVGQIARAFHISRARIGFAGTKDKRAVTTQGVTVKAGPEAAPERIRLPEVEVLRSYRGVRGLALGDLEANEFDIAVTGIESGQGALGRAQAVLAELAAGGCPNYFGTQRFGALRPVTHQVGAALVEGRYAEAVNTYLGTASPFESAEVAAFRSQVRAGLAPRELLARVPERLSFEHQMLEQLAQSPEEPLASLLSLPRNLVLMFVHAHQSELFNRIVSERMRRGLALNEPLEGDLVVPLEEGGGAREGEPVAVTAQNLAKVAKQVKLGRAAVTGAVPGANGTFAAGEMGEIERRVMEAARRKPQDFVLPDLPRFTTPGVRRPLQMTTGAVEATAGQARGRPALRLKFALPRGSYATVLLREVLKRPESSWAVKPGPTDGAAEPE